MMGFAPSGNVKSDLAERNRRSRAPLLRRLFVIGWNAGVLGHVLHFSLLMAAFASSVCHAFIISTSSSASQEAGWIFFLTHAGWPPLLWIWMTYVTACAVPVLYMFCPSSVPDREELLVRSQESGIAYPKKEEAAQTEDDADAGHLSIWNTVAYVQELLYTLVTIYTTVTFVGS